MDDKMLAEAAKRRLKVKPMLTITIGTVGKQGKPHPQGCKCEECQGGEYEQDEDEGEEEMED